MPAARSAGLLLHRAGPAGREVLLGHPGGPYFARRDDGVWSIPKGEYGVDEEPLAAARREFAEELGMPLPAGVQFVPLGEVRQRAGKVVTAWAVELGAAAAMPVEHITSNTFELEWPPKSGRMQSFPELDRAAWFGLDIARVKIIEAQAEFLDRLRELDA